jgi:hypothetical protein
VGGTRDVLLVAFYPEGKREARKLGTSDNMDRGFDRTVFLTWIEFVWLIVGTSEGLL